MSHDLTDAEFQELDELLAQTPEPFEPLDAVMLDGYLCGVIVQPVLLEAEAWLPHVFDFEGQPLPDDADRSWRERTEALILRRHAALTRAIGTLLVRRAPELPADERERLLAFKPEAMYLTHYSRVPDVAAQGAALLRRMDASVAMAEAAAGDGEARHARIKGELTAYLLAELRAHGCMLPEAEILEVLATDLELNAQGLAVWLDTRSH